MTNYFSSSLQRFRAIAFLEGVSFLVLLFVAMPLKYLADMPLPVKYTGWLHGVLFVLYVLALLEVSFKLRWKIQTAVLAFAASLLPCGTFILDAQLLKKKHKG